MALHIFLEDFFDTQIITRKAMEEFFENVSQTTEKEIILDFKKIEFISRSCADEYLKKRSDTKKKIREMNMSEEVKKMIALAYLQYKKNIGIAN